MEYISSISNTNIKKIKALYKKKNREEDKLFIIEGIKIIEEVIDNNYSLELLVINKSFYEEDRNFEFLQKTKGYKVLYVEDSVYKNISDTENPQGILALSKIEYRDFKKINILKNSFFLLLDRIQDPGNMGTIIRTADAMGVDGVILTSGCVDVYNSKVVRSTMGSIFRVPIYNLDDIDELNNIKNKYELSLYSTSLQTSNLTTNIDYNKSIFVIGNESRGVSEDLISISDKLVKIPMKGSAESLNAGVAASIIMYEAMINRFK